MTLRLTDLDFELPGELIAQAPVRPRSACRLMVIDRKRSEISHRFFRDLPEYFPGGAALVVNHSRVLPARFFARNSGGARVEFLFLKQESPSRALFMVRPGRKARPGKTLALETGDTLRVLAMNAEGHRLCETSAPVREILERSGEMPVPPYILGRDFQPEEYRTTFEKEGDSLAAPTAGLHFDPPLIKKISARGAWIEVRLDVGLGTFLPISASNPLEHRMHREWHRLEQAAAAEINRVRAARKPIFACGTTAVRVLESRVDEFGLLVAGEGETDIFITPGFRFRAVDALVTNFHLPRSSLLLLVWAFAGRELITEAYRLAVAEKYRFFSFGDAMLIL